MSVNTLPETSSDFISFYGTACGAPERSLISNLLEVFFLVWTQTGMNEMDNVLSVYRAVTETGTVWILSVSEGTSFQAQA